MAAALSWVFGCTALGPAPVRLSEVADDGDARRRASVRLVLEGLDDEASGRVVGAASQYERALQVDASNPWAYLALARHWVEQGEPDRALAFLDQCEAQLDPADSLRVEAHLAGLRGAALRERDPSASQAWLAQAARLAPETWGDGWLDAQELR